MKTETSEFRAMITAIQQPVRDYLNAHPETTILALWQGLHEMVGGLIDSHMGGAAHAARYHKMIQQFADTLPEPQEQTDNEAKLVFHMGHTILPIPDPESAEWGYVLKRGKLSFDQVADVSDIIHTTMQVGLQNRENAIATAKVIIEQRRCLCCCTGGILQQRKPNQEN